MPPLVIVATARMLLVHVPPGTLPANTAVLPTASVVGPVMVPALVVVDTVKGMLATEVAHVPAVAVWVMLAVPVAIPVTMPDAASIVATAVLLLLQLPPIMVLVKRAVPVGQMLAGPVSTCTAGRPSTVTTCDTAQTGTTE